MSPRKFIIIAMKLFRKRKKNKEEADKLPPFKCLVESVKMNVDCDVFTELASLSPEDFAILRTNIKQEEIEAMREAKNNRYLKIKRNESLMKALFMQQLLHILDFFSKHRKELSDWEA